MMQGHFNPYEFPFNLLVHGHFEANIPLVEFPNSAFLANGDTDFEGIAYFEQVPGQSAPSNELFINSAFLGNGNTNFEGIAYFEQIPSLGA
jgi:hypothetical protein